ncbi:uncharacterized protein KGF55_001424 [Candida pseudojiufengensis]|uniref:uncharacterized protein n=1 Tax=Candida pseudojiufengensis TaxID=497109 RepID=UPI0022257850|nr:uncharacterized protein KGF55_001424 [Candida pseudojiufengensis]KAI5965204.1 hypothetical protein KGF55_001424 [Candida pseudojiufengensis]
MTEPGDSNSSHESVNHSNNTNQHNQHHSKSNHKHQNPNFIIRFFREVFGYRKTSLSLFVILTAVIAISLSYYENSLDYSIKLPDNKYEKELLKKSWLDLEIISKYEHPYASTANDKVHDYLNSTINEIVEGIAYIEVDNNNTIVLNHTYFSPKDIVYFESNNILVKIKGRNPSLPGYLLSAHYDSVPTSFGVTDDGMGIASLLGVLRYYSEQKQPERTIVFNFNNDEEFGLYGAAAFVEHPWFQDVKYFLNLEGTGAGGKAILFRGTDYGVVKYFSNVRFPYATSIFQQGFANGYIHSETDYKIYHEAGLRGLDLAFYKPRDIYHTGLDNIKNINIKSLWHMLSNAIDFTKFISEKNIDDDGESESAIFFSSFNHFFSLPESRLFIINVILIFLFPIVNGILIFTALKYRNLELTAGSFLFVPVSLFVTTLIVSFIVNQIFKSVNPLLPSSSPYLYVITISSFSVLILYLFSNLSSYTSHRDHNDFKLICIIQVSFIYWLVLVFSTISGFIWEKNKNHTGEYGFTILFFLETVTSFLGLLGWTLFSRKKDETVRNVEEEPLLNGNVEERYSSDENDDSDEPDEQQKVERTSQDFNYEWSLQYLLTVPLSFFLIYNSGWLLIEGVNKTIQESLSGEETVYFILQAFAIALVVPMIPFVQKFNRFIIFLVLILSIIGSFTISIKEPFNVKNPMKLRFIQVLSGKNTFVNVYGRQNYVKEALKSLPSIEQSNTSINCLKQSDGNEVCSYETKLYPNILPSKDLDDYLNLTISNTTKTKSFGINIDEFTIVAPQSRQCNIEFSGTEVKAVILKNGSKEIPPFKRLPDGFSKDENFYYKDVHGLSKIYLNKLNFNSTFDLGLYWIPSIDDETNALEVKVECFWADLKPISYDEKVKPAIPAYNELIHYTPNHISIANKDRGLVSAAKKIKLKSK